MYVRLGRIYLPLQRSSPFPRGIFSRALQLPDRALIGMAHRVPHADGHAGGHLQHAVGAALPGAVGPASAQLPPGFHQHHVLRAVAAAGVSYQRLLHALV